MWKKIKTKFLQFYYGRWFLLTHGWGWYLPNPEWGEEDDKDEDWEDK